MGPRNLCLNACIIPTSACPNVTTTTRRADLWQNRHKIGAPQDIVKNVFTLRFTDYATCAFLILWPNSRRLKGPSK